MTHFLYDLTHVFNLNIPIEIVCLRNCIEWFIESCLWDSGKGIIYNVGYYSMLHLLGQCVRTGIYCDSNDGIVSLYYQL